MDKFVEKQKKKKTQKRNRNSIQTIATSEIDSVIKNFPNI